MTSIPGPYAIALCVHHKPWLAMSTLLTALVQAYMLVPVYAVHVVVSAAAHGGILALVQ